jgi:hypothetical protein
MRSKVSLLHRIDALSVSRGVSLHQRHICRNVIMMRTRLDVVCGVAAALVFTLYF